VISIGSSVAVYRQGAVAPTGGRPHKDCDQGCAGLDLHPYRRHTERVMALVRGMVLFALILLTGCGAVHDELPGFPKLMLWAWERPENMSFLDPDSAGVAFLARTISWRNGVLESRARMQPLQAPPATAFMAVVRLESGGGSPPDAESVAREAAKGALTARALQIDFDATRSERAWYREFLKRLRADLPPQFPLEITALTSWCLHDDWIAGLPVGEAVPMLFRMGPGEGYSGGDFRDPLCRSAVGVSTDELPRAVPRGRRLFVFHPRPWTADAYQGALRLAREWL
jgi:hypothetical protein